MPARPSLLSSTGVLQNILINVNTEIDNAEIQPAQKTTSKANAHTEVNKLLGQIGIDPAKGREAYDLMKPLYQKEAAKGEEAEWEVLLFSFEKEMKKKQEQTTGGPAGGN